MFRFFVTTEAINNKEVVITGSDYNHISNSLRLSPGDRVIVTTGDGYEKIVELKEFNKGEAKGLIIEEKPNNTEPSVKLTLAQGIPKKSKMDLIVQKGTEIGVSRFIPLETRRTIVKLKGKKRKRRIQRWRRVAKEAAKQAQRGKIPVVEEIRDIKRLVELKDFFDLIIVPWEDEKRTSLQKVLTEDINKILLVIGPEGGFPEEEIEFLQEIGGNTITLGPRILRTETAALVASTMVLHQTGDLGGY